MTKIMNWNIQQFGDARSRNQTRLELVAFQVANEDIDIMVLIELNTSKPDVAINILRDRLIPEIESEYYRIHSTNQSYNFTISARQGSETYAYIYKDAIRACALDNTHYDEYDDLTDANFITTNNSTTFNPNATTLNLKSNFFPIMEDYTGKWFGRQCCFGAFRLANNSLLFIVSVHSMATLALSGPNLYNYDIFDVLEQTIQIDIDGNQEDTDWLIYTGDFNVDYLGNNKNIYYYGPLQNSNLYNITLNRLTHLKGYKGSRKYANSYDLRSYCYDNFFIKGNNINPHNQGIIDIPQWIKSNKNVYKKILNDTNLLNASIMNELTKEIICKWVEDNVKGKKRQIQICDVVVNSIIKYETIDNESIKKIASYCPNQQVFKEIMAEVVDTLKESNRQLFRFSNLRMSNRNELKWHEALLLTRLISDHLPTVVEV